MFLNHREAQARARHYAGTRFATRVDYTEPTDLSKSTVVKLTGGGLLLGSLVLIWSISYHNTITPVGIVIHHSSVIPPSARLLPSAEKLPLDLEPWDGFHKKRGFGVFYWGHIYHIGYHYVIFPNGTVKQGRPERCVGAHAKGFNSYLGIALVGDFNASHHPTDDQAVAKPTPEQLQALALLCRRLRARYNIPLSRILRHRDLARTACPGSRFPYREFLEQIR